MQATNYIGLTIILIVHTSGFEFVKYEDSDCLLTLETDGISVVNHGINLINSSIQISGRFFEALQDLYNTDKSTVSSTISNSLNEFGNEYILHDFKRFKDVNLEKSVIYTSTFKDFISSINLYSLNDHKCGKKNLDEEDKSLAPYTAYLMAVLLYSPNLPKETNLTDVKIYWRNMDLYKIGTTFLWPSFALSAEYTKTATVTMVINNSQESKWSPRRLGEYSPFPEDNERLYPPGAMFRVTGKRTQGYRVYIYADLISED